MSIDSNERGLAFFSGFALVINAIRTAPVFVIGRIHSHTVGGGVGLACAVDIAYAHESASARLSELAIGIGPFVVGPVIEFKIGRGPYGAMALDADWRDAAWAERHGLYAQVVADATALDAAVAARAKSLAEANPEATRGIKRVLWEGTEQWADLLEHRAAMSGELVLSEFTRAAIAQFRAL